MQPQLELILMWVGFGSILGILSQAMLPSKRMAGNSSLQLWSIFGSLFACAMVHLWNRNATITPVSYQGAFAGLIGVGAVLVVVQLLSEYDLPERQLENPRQRRRRRRNYVPFDE